MHTAAGSPEGSRRVQAIKHEADGFRGVVFAMSSLGTGPLRDETENRVLDRSLNEAGCSAHGFLTPCGPAFRLVRIARVRRAGRAVPPERHATPRAMPLPDG
jgi:hypothetical protein